MDSALCTAHLFNLDPAAQRARTSWSRAGTRAARRSSTSPTRRSPSRSASTSRAIRSAGRREPERRTCGRPTGTTATSTRTTSRRAGSTSSTLTRCPRSTAQIPLEPPQPAGAGAAAAAGAPPAPPAPAARPSVHQAQRLQAPPARAARPALRSAVIFVGGRRARSSSGKALRRPVRLRDLPRGRVRIDVTLRDQGASGSAARVPTGSAEGGRCGGGAQFVAWLRVQAPADGKLGGGSLLRLRPSVTVCGPRAPESAALLPVRNGSPPFLPISERRQNDRVRAERHRRSTVAVDRRPHTRSPASRPSRSPSAAMSRRAAAGSDRDGGRRTPACRSRDTPPDGRDAAPRPADRVLDLREWPADGPGAWARPASSSRIRSLQRSWKRRDLRWAPTSRCAAERARPAP